MSATWEARAACAAWPELPWTADTHAVPSVLVEQMASICHACPVALDCLAAVDALDVTGGFWAGRDRDPHPGHTLCRDTADTDAVPVAWERLATRAGRLLAEQAAFDFTTLGGAA